MQSSDSFDFILDQVRGAWRFRWWALIATWVVALACWLVIFLLPDTYQASARVFVDTRTTLSKVTAGLSVESDIDTQIQRVRQSLLGAPQLQSVAEKTDLMTGALTARERQEVIDRLRRQIEIQGSGTGISGSVYVIAYKNQSRDTSLRVVEELLNTFVEGSLGGKREGSAQAQQFLVTQIADYERRLSEAESRLASFKKENVALMPGAQGDYFSRLQSEMEAVTKLQADVTIATRRRDELQRQLRGEQQSRSSPTGGTDSAIARVVGMSATATRIREAEAKLEETLLRFTDRHPDVIALRQTLDELKSREEAELSELRRGEPGAVARSGLTANPVFQSIQLQLNQSEVELAALRADVLDRQRRVATLRGLVTLPPRSRPNSRNSIETTR